MGSSIGSSLSSADTGSGRDREGLAGKEVSVKRERGRDLTGKAHSDDDRERDRDLAGKAVSHDRELRRDMAG